MQSYEVEHIYNHNYVFGLQGEYLKLAPNSCCPTCGKSAKGCSYQGHSVPRTSALKRGPSGKQLHNAEFSSRPCETCLCDNGDFKCTNHTCPPLTWSCNSEGEMHPDGSEWQPLPCTKCVCRNGQSVCYIKQCPPVICRQITRKGSEK
ncbi:hypothetical protein NP493_40g01001 [Ridgeia piscesae]|uniref:VWFC domain-containing protein n=1 Tax=Ridgeia piscesae TaxID=27915 RepID=A0AAD9PC15_RIDPI|nr:hypothetical protein NP493_40g01001 [Ridgeia piscesae]